jgi:hypothetical protein
MAYLENEAWHNDALRILGKMTYCPGVIKVGRESLK